MSWKSLGLSGVLGLLTLAGVQLAGSSKALMESAMVEGDRLLRSGDFAGAAETYRRAQALAGRSPADALQTRVHYLEGIQAANRNDLARSGELFAKALAEARRAGDRRREGRCLHACGNIALRQNDYPRAEELYRAAMVIAAESRKPDSLLILSYRGLGDVASQLGRNDEALRYYAQGLSAARRASDRKQVEGILNSIGSLYLELADYTKALQHFQEALRIGTEDRSELSYALNNLGIVYGYQGNSDLALEYFQRALHIAEEARDDYARMRALNNIGALHEGERHLEQAREYFTRALRLAEANDDRSAMIGHWHSLGSVYAAQGRNTLAAAAYQKSLLLAEELGERHLVAQALEGLAQSEMVGNPRQALALADRAAATAAETGSRETFWRTRTLAGRALQALGRDKDARKAFGDAIATLELLRRSMPGGELVQQAFFAERIEPYQRLIEQAADSGEAAAALAQAERTKGRVLLEILRSGRLDLASPWTPEDRATEQRLRERLASLNAELFLARSRAVPPSGAPRDLKERLQRARRELEAFNTNVYASRPVPRTRRADFPPWTLRDAVGLLNRGGTALIEYAVLADRTYLFTVTAEGDGVSARVRLYRLPVGREDLRREVEAFRSRLAARDLDFRRPARRLYDLLLAPAAAELRGSGSLCIVPDGPLWELPFQALQPDDSSVLLSQHSVYFAPSLSFLSELASRQGRRPSRSTTLLAVGDPEAGDAAVSLASNLRSRLARLPEAAREVRSVAQLYGADRSVVYTQAAASEERVKAEAEKYQVLHFATHALLDDRNPMYSSLVLSQARTGGGEDGLLETWELFDLHLQADLVVLSACQTARGRPRAGEGLIGMTWALAAAGSPATLASQWEVDSASTSQLMVEFHRGWLAGLDKAEALRRAALATRAEERYRHPFYWAAFVLVGEGG